MNKVEQIINTKNKKIQESLKVFVERNFDYTNEKNKENKKIAKNIFLLKDSNRFEIDKRIFDYESIYKNGIVTGLIVKGICMYNLNNRARAFARENVMITTNNERDIIHESEHVLQNIFGLIDSNERWKLEYDAYLVSILFSENSKGTYREINREVKNEIEKIHCNYNDTKSRYNIQIGLPNIAGKWELAVNMEKLLINIKHTNENVKEACTLLLNESYKAKVGLTYEQIIQQIRRE